MNSIYYTTIVRQKPVLIIQHAPHEHPATMKRALELQGISTQIIHPYLKEPYPQVSAIKGIISLGGPMSSNDEKTHPWIRNELDLFRDAIRLQVPSVGICLGAQLMARSLGARVTVNKTAEVGWLEITLNEAGKSDPILKSSTQHTVYQWHNDTFEIPTGAEHLASSEACATQAFKFNDHAYGFQFHPEVDAQLISEWLALDEVAKDIHDAQKKYGNSSVQCADTQRQKSLGGEKSNIKITTALCQLFREKPYAPIDCEIHDEYESASVKKQLVQIEINNAVTGPKIITGTLIDVFTLNFAEFTVIRDENRSIWSVRLDDVIKLSVK